MKKLLSIPILALSAGFSAHAASHAAHSGNRPAQVRPSHPTANGSFLGQKVYTVPDLIAQIETNPAIASRYARHYHTTPGKVVHYLRSNVVESYMPRTQVFHTYWIRHNGSIRSGNERLVKGTRVFALRNGEPVLKWACGNPLTVSLPFVKTKVAAAPVKFAQKMSADIEVHVPSEPTDTIVPSETDTVPVEAVSANAAILTAPEPPVTHTHPVSFSPLAAAAPTHVGLSLSTIGALASVPIVIAAAQTQTHSSPDPAPTPESGTLVSLSSLALAGFAFTRKRVKSKKA